jgi:hypothetical protein
LLPSFVHPSILSQPLRSPTDREDDDDDED